MEEQNNVNVPPVGNATAPTPDPMSTPVPSVSPETKQSPILMSILAILLILSLGGIVYFAFQNMQLSKEIAVLKATPTPVAYASPSPVAATDPTANWQTYTNSLWKFSLKYPPSDLVSCSPNDVDGLRLWKSPYNCGPGDVLYEVSAIGYKTSDYKEPTSVKTSTKIVMVSGVNATENVYTYGESDGPLMSAGGSREVLIPTKDGVIQLISLGNSTEIQNRFDQILATFKFAK